MTSVLYVRRRNFTQLTLIMETKPATTSNNIINFSPETLIAQAIDKGLPVETMEKLLMMRKELKAEFAKEAFDQAMAHLQGDLTVITKDKKVDFTSKRTGNRTTYSYAPIDSIVRQTKDPIARNGLSYCFTTEQTDSSLTATCTVKHSLGHRESTSFRVPLDPEAFMSAPQKVGAAMTYAKRYAFCNAFGIMTGDEDPDAVDNDEPKPVVKATTAPVAKSSPPSTSPKCPGFDGSGKCGASLTGTYQLCYNCNLKKKYGPPAPKTDTGELTPEEIKAYEQDWNKNNS